MTNFNILTKEEENKLTKEELNNYYKTLREYYKSLSINKFNIKIKEIIHPILLNGVKLIRKNPLKIINQEELNRSEPMIFVVNHSNAHDFPTVSEVIKKHFHILADYTMKKDIAVNTLNRLNGCVYVDRKNKDDRKKSKEELLKLLANNKNILLFPEGTWNLTENKMMLPLNWGVIDIAKMSGCPIIPIVLDYDDNIYYGNVGDAIYIDVKSDKLDEILKLTDIMSTLRWELFEKKEMLKRKELPNDYNKTFIKEELSTYKKLDYEYEMSTILNDHNSPEEVYKPIKKLKITKKNAFLLNNH